MIRRTLAIALAAAGLAALPTTPARAAATCSTEANTGTVLTPAYCDDVTPPQLALDSVSPPANPAGYTRSGQVTFTFHAVNTDANDQGPFGTECKLDDASTYTDCTSPTSYTGLTEGTHTFSVRAYDGGDRPIRAQVTPCTPVLETCPHYTEPAVTPHEGDDSAARTLTWTIDTTVPETYVVDSPYDLDFTSAPLSTGVPTVIGLSSSESPRLFRCTLDGSSVPCAARTALGDTTPGLHTLVAAAIDRAGNVDPTPETTKYFLPQNVSRPAKQKLTWRRTTGSAYFDHDLVTAKKLGAVLKLGRVSRVKGIQLIAPCGPTMGAFRLRIGVSRSIKVSQKCASAQAAKVYLLRDQFNMALSGPLKVTTLSKRPVSLDAIALRH